MANTVRAAVGGGDLVGYHGLKFPVHRTGAQYSLGQMGKGQGDLRPMGIGAKAMRHDPKRSLQHLRGFLHLSFHRLNRHEGNTWHETFLLHVGQ
jgi:hypothetical protein